MQVEDETTRRASIVTSLLGATRPVSCEPGLDEFEDESEACASTADDLSRDASPADLLSLDSSSADISRGRVRPLHANFLLYSHHASTSAFEPR